MRVPGRAASRRFVPALRRPPASAACALLPACVLLVLAGPSTAVAQTVDAPDSSLRLDIAGDATVMALSLLALQFPTTLDDSIAWRAPHLRDRSAVNPFDRIATRQWSPAAGTASDVLLWAGVGGVFAASGIEALVHRHTARKWVIQGVVMAESLLVASGLTQLVKYSVRRARPQFYNPAAPASSRDEPNANLSFWSGHTASVAAVLTSFAVVQWLDEPGGPLAWASVVAAGLVIPTVAVLRVAAGRHYPTDVIAGGAVGVAVGVAVPFLHRWKPAGAARSLRVDPLLLQGGSGAVATLAW